MKFSKGSTRQGSVALGRALSFDCIVQDLNSNNARLNVPASVDLPRRFALTIAPQDEQRSCKVMSRSSDEVLIVFENAVAE